MRNKLNYIKNSWTFNHKILIIALSLATAHVWPLIPLPDYSSDDIVYTAAAATTTPTLESEIEKRTLELYETNKTLDLEKYRHEAIKEVNEQLQYMVYDSPYVDYPAMKEKYGY